MQGQHNISSAPRKGTKSAKNKSAPLHTNNEIIRWAFKDFDDRDNLSIVDADDDDYVENDRHVKSTKSTDSQQENTENNAKPKKKKNGLKLSSSMSKSIPGILQKNITTERKFIKDLLSLSQQRQVNLLLLDFQKKSFINKQAFKGIYPLDSRRSFSVNQNNNNNNHSRINEISSSASTRIKSSSSSLKANSSNDLSNGFQSSSMMRRRSSNLSTLKLNTELTRLHQIEMSELTENYNKLSARRNGEKYRVSNSSVEGHVIEDIAVINVPENVNNEAPKVENLQTKPKTVKLAATIALSPRIDKNTDINPDSFRKRADPKSDTRYQDLLVSMSTVYTPKKVSKETPDERIYRLLRSNTAFLTSSSDARSFESLLEKSKPIRRNVKENLHFFEKSISCL